MPDTITAEELTEQLREIGYISGHTTRGVFMVFRVDFPGNLARMIFRKALEKRQELKPKEPPWYMWPGKPYSGSPLSPEEIEADLAANPCIIRSDN